MQLSRHHCQWSAAVRTGASPCVMMKAAAHPSGSSHPCCVLRVRLSVSCSPGITTTTLHTPVSCRALTRTSMWQVGQASLCRQTTHTACCIGCEGRPCLSQPVRVLLVWSCACACACAWVCVRVAVMRHGRAHKRAAWLNRGTVKLCVGAPLLTRTQKDALSHRVCVLPPACGVYVGVSMAGVVVGWVPCWRLLVHPGSDDHTLRKGAEGPS